MYNDIVCCLEKAGNNLYSNVKKKKYVNRPGWSEYVSEFYKAARDAFSIWCEVGKPRQGPVFELRKRSNARFKYALRFIKSNEEVMRKDSLAKKLAGKSPKAFWDEIKRVSNNTMSLPTNIEGVTGRNNIAELWRNHYKDLFNCLHNCGDIYGV